MRLSVDAGYKDSDRLYRVMSNLKMGDDEILTWSITPGPVRDAILETIPEAEPVVRGQWWHGRTADATQRQIVFGTR